MTNLIDNNYNSFISQIDEYHWISSEGGWNCLGENKTSKYFLGQNGLLGSYIQGPMIKGEGCALWSTTYEYLNYFDSETSSFSSFQLESSGIPLKFGYKVIDVDTITNELYLKVENGIYKYNYVEGVTTLLSDKINSISFTRSKRFNENLVIGNPWLNENGIEVFNENWEQQKINFEDCFFHSGIVVSDVISTPDANWLISDFEIIEYNHLDPCASVYYPSPFSNPFSFAIESENSLILSTEGSGLVQFNIVKETFKKLDNLNLSSNRPVEIFMDADDYVWVSHRNSNVDRIHKTELYKHKVNSEYGTVAFRFLSDTERILIKNHLDEVFELGDIDICNFVVEKTDNYKERYFVRDFNIFYSNNSNEVKKNTPYEGLISDVFNFDSIQLMYKVRATSLYVKNNEFDTLIRYNHIINDADRINNSEFIVSTKGGLILHDLDLKSIETVFENEVHSSELVKDDIYFVSNTGLYKYNLISTELKRLPCSADLIQGKADIRIANDFLFLVAYGYVYRYDIEEFEIDTSLNIDLDFIKMNNCLFPKSESFSISSGDAIKFFPFIKGVNLHPFSIDYSIDDENYSLYQGDSIVLRNLDVGTHLLRITGIDNGLNRTKERIFTITVLPPYYQTWWFRTLCILGLIGIGFLISYFRTRQKLKKQQILLDRQEALQSQRNRMSQDLHDEMGSGLSAIKHLSATQANKDKDLQIESIATNLIRSMRDLLWSLDESNDTLHCLSVKIRQASNQLLRNGSIKHKVKVELNDEKVSITGPTRRNLILVVKEIINNALKHSQASTMDIVLTSDDTTLFIDVSDNGVGYDTLVPSTGYGLKSINKRLADIGASSKVTSDHSGTNIHISLPLI